MTRTVEIAVSWGEALLDVQHVRPRALSPNEPLDAPVVIERAGRLCCLSPEGARRALVSRGVYRSHGDMEAVRELDALSGGALVLSDGARARVEIGALTYELRSTAPLPETPRSRGSRALRFALLGALALHAPLFLALALAPPRAAALSLDREPPPARLIALLPEPAIEKPPSDAVPRQELDIVAHPPPFTWEPEPADPIESAFFWATGGTPPHSHATAWRDRHRSSCACLPLARPRAHSSDERPAASARPGRAQVVGDLRHEVVRRVVRQHLAEVRFCYERGLHEYPSLRGRVTVSWIVGAGGRVTSAAIASSDLQSDAVEACITSAVRRWTFPSSESVTGVSYPFMLEAR